LYLMTKTGISVLGMIKLEGERSVGILLDRTRWPFLI
jgi:hypothetical protein